MTRKVLPIVGLLLVAVALYFSFDWAVGAVVHQRRVVMVPNVSDRAVADALTMLSQSHLGMAKDGEQYDKQHGAGLIIHQSPEAGMMVREGRVIHVIVSQGGETLFVPDLVGQPLRNAQTALQNVGLTVGEVDRRPSLKFEPDMVMVTDPPAGAQVAKSTLVNLVLSAGAPGSDVLLVPDFVGKNANEAKNWASTHQIPVFSREESDLTKPAEEILSQAPPGDVALHPGETLTIVINTASVSSDGPHVRYDVPADGSDRDIKIIVVDEAGEHEVFRKSQPPGSHIDLPVTVKGRAQARIFVNGIMAHQQDIR